jgi:hypothetical protein
MKQNLENRLRRLESAQPEMPAKRPALDWSNFTHAEAKMVLESVLKFRDGRFCG